MAFLVKVKELYQGSGTVAFELDQRNDRSFNCTGMHTFCTPDLHLELECSYDFNCYVNYDFQGCKHKDRILALAKKIYPMRENVFQYMPLPGGVLNFYQRVRQLHPACCFKML